jgi:hypothetical protein
MVMQRMDGTVQSKSCCGGKEPKAQGPKCDKEPKGPEIVDLFVPVTTEKDHGAVQQEWNNLRNLEKLGAKVLFTPENQVADVKKFKVDDDPETKDTVKLKEKESGTTVTFTEQKLSKNSDAHMVITKEVRNKNDSEKNSTINFVTGEFYPL